MLSDKKLLLRNVRGIWWYHVPNVNKNADGNGYHSLFSFYPFRNENNFKPFSETYPAKLHQSEALKVFNRNKQIMAPLLEFVDTA